MESIENDVLKKHSISTQNALFLVLAINRFDSIDKIETIRATKMNLLLTVVVDLINEHCFVSFD